MTTRSDGWARLTADVLYEGEGNVEVGAQKVLDSVMSRIAEGEDPRAVARSRGYTWYVLKEWVKANPERVQAFTHATECAADGFAYESNAVVKGVTKSIEGKEDSAISEQDVIVAEIRTKTAKLQADHFTKQAGKMNREAWGDRVQMDVKTTHTVDIRALLEAREARLMTLDAPRLPVVVEQVADVSEERVL